MEVADLTFASTLNRNLFNPKSEIENPKSDTSEYLSLSLIEFILHLKILNQRKRLEIKLKI